MRSLTEIIKKIEISEEFHPEIRKQLIAFWKRYENGEVTQEKSLGECIAEANFSDEFDSSMQVTCEFRLK